MHDASVLERLLRRDRAIALAGLLTLWALTWVYLAGGAGLGAMPPGSPAPTPAASAMASMPGMASPAAAHGADASAWWLVVAMWWAMMIAMMAPAAAPTILLYARVHRHAHAQGHAVAADPPIVAFASGYFLAWMLFSLVAAALQEALRRAGLLSATTLTSEASWLSGGVLVAAGCYQLSPWKHACLSRCRAPSEFLSRHWRPGASGALRLGLVHGAWCIGCCWLLMALLFVGGVMNLAWIAGLSLLVLAEKWLATGPWFGWATGALLVGWGGLVLLSR